MQKNNQPDDTLKKNRSLFLGELKLSVNQSLFDKHIITEDMYRTAKDFLLKQTIL